MQHLSNCSKEYNWGIAVLKFFLMYLVVCNHFGTHSSLDWVGAYAVPSFMMLAFMLGKRLWQSNDYRLLMDRVVRLAWPFVFWSLFYWLISGRGFKALIGQLVFGHTVCLPLYFLVLLMWFTIWIWMVRKWVVINRWLLGSLAVLACLFLQYAGWNVRIVSWFCSAFGGQRYVLGRIAELLPAAIIGLGLVKILELNIISRIRKPLIFVGIVLFLISAAMRNYFFIPSGFNYQGVHLLVGSAGIVFAFTLLGNEILLADSYLRNIKFVTKELMGVYCIHMLCGQWIVMGGGWTRSFIVYVISLCVVKMIARVNHLRRFVE